MRAIVIVLIALSCTAGAQWAEPLDVRNHRSADLVFLRLTPRTGVTSKGSQLYSYSLVVANEFRRVGPIDEDSETVRLLLDYREGFSDGWEGFVEVPLISRGGGFLDPIIDWWHDAILSNPNPLRDAAANGRSVVSFPGGGPFGSTTGIGDVTLGVARELSDNLYARAALKLPTGNSSQLLGSGSTDTGVSMDWRHTLSDQFVLDMHGALVLQGNARELTGTRRSVYASSVSFTWQMNTRDALTAQWSTEQSPTKTGIELLDRDHRVMSFGYQRRIDGNTLLQFYLSEDGDFKTVRFPGGATTGPDLTIGFRLIQRK